jgi:hypothetical protein
MDSSRFAIITIAPKIRPVKHSQHRHKQFLAKRAAFFLFFFLLVTGAVVVRVHRFDSYYAYFVSDG